MKRDTKGEPPALIDYSEVSTSVGAPSSYWTKELVKKHRIGTPSFWSIKDRTLWKRLRAQFGDDVLLDMVDVWMNMPHKGIEVSNFISFYMRRGEIYEKVKPQETDYGFDT